MGTIQPEDVYRTIINYSSMFLEEFVVFERRTETSQSVSYGQVMRYNFNEDRLEMTLEYQDGLGQQRLFDQDIFSKNNDWTMYVLSDTDKVTLKLIGWDSFIPKFRTL